MASNKNTTNSQTSDKPSKEAKAKPVKAVKSKAEAKPKVEAKSAAPKKPSTEKKAPAAKEKKSVTATKAKTAPVKKTAAKPSAAKKASVEKVMKGSKSQAKKTTSHKAKTSVKGPISIEVIITAIDTAKNDYAEYHQNAHQHVSEQNAKNGLLKQLHQHHKGLANANEFTEHLRQQESLEELMDELRRFLSAAERSYYPHSFASYVSASLAEMNVINPHLNKRYSQEAVVRELRKWVNTNLGNQHSGRTKE